MFEKDESIPEFLRHVLPRCSGAAEPGDARAQFDLGMRYVTGQGVVENDQQAAAWFYRAAQQGHTDARFCLGFMYAEGRGVPQDDRAAVVWYRKAAGQGHAGVQGNLSIMFEDG